ncbi:MAG: BlaI/MecI/CopY family transcriptional regulator [Eubacteriales bacterium]
MEKKIFDSELKVMDVIWEKGDISAKDVSLKMAELAGWNKNTTYTVIKKLEAKGYIKRTEPGFICSALVSRKEVSKSETDSLVERLFGGSKKALFSALLEDEALTSDEIEELRKMIEKR